MLFFLNLLFQNSFFLHGWNSVATDSNSSIIPSPATDILLSAAMSLIYLFVYSLQTRTLHAVCKHTATVLQSPLSLAPLDISQKCDRFFCLCQGSSPAFLSMVVDGRMTSKTEQHSNGCVYILTHILAVFKVFPSLGCCESWCDKHGD